MSWFSLPQILQSILGAGNLEEAKAKALKDIQSAIAAKANAQRGRSSGENLAYCIFKCIGAAMHPHTGLSVEQRVAVGDALADQTASALETAAAKVRLYSEAQAILERSRGTAEEQAARATRERCEQALTTACVNIARAATGQRQPEP